MSHFVKLENPNPRWNNAIYTGWMTKRGSFVKNWKRRYFVLTADGNLFYFASPKKGQSPKGCWEVHGCTVTKDDKYKELCLRIDRKKGSPVYFCQNSQDSQTGWMEHLKTSGCIVPELSSSSSSSSSQPQQQQQPQPMMTTSSPSNSLNNNNNNNVMMQQPPQPQQMYPQQQQQQQIYPQNPVMSNMNPNPMMTNQQQQQQQQPQFQQIPLSQYDHTQQPQVPIMNQQQQFQPSHNPSYSLPTQNPQFNNQQQSPSPSPIEQSSAPPMDQIIQQTSSLQLPILSEKRVLLKLSIQNNYNQLSEMIKVAPQNFETYLNRGRFAFEYLNNFSQALLDLQKCLQLNPNCCDAHVEMADIFACSSKWDLSFKQIQKISTIDSSYKNYKAEMILGKFHSERNEYKIAIKHYENSLQMYPNFIRCIVAKALAFNYSGLPQECMKHINQALSLPAQTYWDFQAKGVAFFVLQKVHESVVQLDACLDINPNCYLAWNTMGAINMKIDSDKAISSFMMVIHLNPEYCGAYQNLGMLLLEKNELDSAFMYASKAVEMNPKLPNLYVIRGHVFFRKGDKVSANIEFKKAVDLQPALEKNLRDLGVYTL